MSATIHGGSLKLNFVEIARSSFLVPTSSNTAVKMLTFFCSRRF